MPVKPGRAPLAEERAGAASALVVIDMFSGWDFPDAGALATGARRIAPSIQRLRRRCRGAGVPLIYVNDNDGRWRSDSTALLERSAARSDTGAFIDACIRPGLEDYVVLKPKHSAFYATPLDLLLRHLRVRRVLIAGVATDQCIFLSAVEARMLDYDVAVVSDCVAARTAARSSSALRHLSAVHLVSTPSALNLKLR